MQISALRSGLSSIEGGKARNAIPREAEALIVVPAASLELIRVYFESFVQILKDELERWSLILT